MTRKDYERIAGIIRTELDEADSPFHTDGERNLAMGTAESIAHKLADVLESDNPRFNRAQFYRACGIDNYGE